MNLLTNEKKVVTGLSTVTYIKPSGFGAHITLRIVNTKTEPRERIFAILDAKFQMKGGVMVEQGYRDLKSRARFTRIVLVPTQFAIDVCACGASKSNPSTMPSAHNFSDLLSESKSHLEALRSSDWRCTCGYCHKYM